MFKWKNKSFSIFLINQYQFQYQLPGQLVSTRIWIRPVQTFNLSDCEGLIKNYCLAI